MTAEALVKGFQKMHVADALRFWVRVVSWGRHCCRQKIDAGWRKHERAKFCSAVFSVIYFGAWPADCATNHVPDNDTVNLLLAGNNFSAQAGMDARPYIVPGIGARISADAPDDKFLSLGRSFKDVGIVAVKTPFKLNNGNTS